jgi:hypothetical protein
MQTPDWNVFSQHVNKLAQAQVNHLKELTRNHLQVGNNEKKARYIKVAYIDDYDGPPLHNAQGTKTPPPRVVLWEEHTLVDGLDANQNKHATNVDALKKSLRTQYLPDDLRNLKTELYFASMQLRSQKRHSEPETLRHYLLSYCDKIYAKPLPQQSNATWTQYKDYFNQAQMMILANPTLYTELCLNLKELFSHPSSSIVISEDKLYSYLVLLRSLPDTVARTQDGCIEAAKSLKELLALLDILDDDESALAHETTYNVINAIEWLTYLLPQTYGTMLTSTMSPPLYEELVECLEKYISSEKYKLAIRMEAAWALGWASISSIGVANCVHQYDKSARWRVDRLRSNVLRHVVSTAYLRASFTLVSFGPARISSSSVEPLPGGYLSDQASGQINISPFDSARHAAANIVYGEIEQIVNGNIRFQLLLTALAACWLVTNDLIAILFSLSMITKIWLAVMPILVLVVLMALLTRGWGKGYWWRIVVIWAAFVLLVTSPWIDIINWRQTFIVGGALITFLTIIIGFLSSWISVLAVFPTLMRFFRSKRKP